MRKHGNDMKNDLDFVRSRMGGAPDLPEALAPEEIAAAVSGKKQKANVKKLARRWVSLAVAACLLITATTLWRWSAYAPKVTSDAATYEEVGTMLLKYRRSRIGKDLIENLGSVRLFDFRAKSAAPQEYAEEDAAIGGDLAPVEESAFDTLTNTAASASAERSADHAETNTRERGVYEDDVIHTDGRYLYILANGRSFRIVDTANGALTVAGAADLRNGETDRDLRFTGFYLCNELAVFVGQESFYEDDLWKTRAAVRVYDISDVSAPAELRALSFDGYPVSSRVVEDRMILVTQFEPYSTGVDYDDFTTFIPACYENGDVSYQPEDGLYFGGTDEAESFTTVSVFSLAAADSPVERCSAFGGSADVYCTARSLYVYRTNWNEKELSTGILRFDIGGGAPVFSAKGSVPGRLLNTFSLDEYGGYLRAASTLGGWSDESENRVFVLDGALNEIGRSEPLAKGEEIWGVRFMGNAAYVVTFHQTDPLFVLDLTDPTKPVVTGELKLPGFSAYLHPAGEGYLLGVGRGGTEEGLDGSAKLSLFDVSDPFAPKEVSQLRLEDAYFADGYKAFVDMGDGSFLIPYESWTETVETDEYGGEYYGYASRCGAVRAAVYNGELIRLNDYRVPDSAVDIPRASFIGGTVYLVNGIYYEYGWDDAIDVYAFGRDSGEQLAGLQVPVDSYGEWITYDLLEDETAVAEAEAVGENSAADADAPAEPETAAVLPAD